MISWIAMKLGLPIPAVKLILSAAAIGAICLCLRWYGNRQWYKGETAGRQFVSKELEKRKQTEWKVKEAAIASSAANIITQKRAVEAATEQLAQDRITINRSLKDALAATAARRNRDYASTLAVPDTQLWGVIRSVSGELAAQH